MVLLAHALVWLAFLSPPVSHVCHHGTRFIVKFFDADSKWHKEDPICELFIYLGESPHWFLYPYVHIVTSIKFLTIEVIAFIIIINNYLSCMFYLCWLIFVAAVIRQSLEFLYSWKMSKLMEVTLQLLYRSVTLQVCKQVILAELWLYCLVSLWRWSLLCDSKWPLETETVS